MRIVTVLAAAGLTAAFCAGLASAQQNPVEERESLMKKNDRNEIVLIKMAKGELPYDAAKVNEAFDQWADTAKKLPSLFPDNAKEGGDNRALPTIWTNRPEFDKQIATFAKDVQEQRAKATSGVAGLKAAMEIIDNDCNSCHKQFRRRSRR